MSQEIPAEARNAFRAHKNNAKRRGITFLFSLEEWWAWWQVDNRWSSRGRKDYQLVMCRRADAGPYSLENVYCATQHQNRLDQKAPLVSLGERSKAAWARRKEHGLESHLTDRAMHPRNRGVVTPDGYFPSAALAGERYGIHRNAASYRCRRGIKGWRWAPAP
jgi:hypothetical protein